MKKSMYLLGMLFGITIPIYFIAKLQQNCIDQWKEQADKNSGLFLLMDQWVNIKQKGKNLKDYFLKNNYEKIAIYGMGRAGQRLVEELRNTEIEVLYGIDSDINNIYSDINLVTVEDDLQRVDAVVVTALGEFDAVYDILCEKMDCPMIAIEDILNEI